MLLLLNIYERKAIYLKKSLLAVPINAMVNRISSPISVSNYYASAYKHTYMPKFLHSLWRRANARNVSFETFYGGQFRLSTQLIILNYPIILSHRRSTTVSLETYPLYSYCPLPIWSQESGFTDWLSLFAAWRNKPVKKWLDKTVWKEEKIK